MKKQTVFILLGIFVIMLAIVLLPSFSPSLFTPKQKAEFSFVPFTKDQTKSLVLESAGKKIELSNTNNSWKVGEFAAVQNKIDDLFSSLSVATPGPIVSNNPKNASEYSLASGSATVVSLHTASQTLTVWIGKRGPSGNSFYAKKEGSSNVYLLPGTLLDVLSLSVSDWRDKTVTKFASQDVTSVIFSGGKNLKLTKKDDKTWNLEVNGATKTINNDDVKTPITSISSIIANDFAAESDKKLFETTKESILVNIKNKDGKDLSVFTAVPTQNQYYLVQVLGGTDIYKISAYILDDIVHLTDKK